MNKEDLKDLMAKKNDITKVEAGKNIDMFIDAIEEALKQEFEEKREKGKLSISKFMTFNFSETKAREGKVGGHEYSVDAGYNLKASLSKTLKQEIVGE